MRNPSDERGQAIIIAAFALVVLLVAAGLAIDGGMLHFNRRRMQNASDAASLAGTRMLAEAICIDPSVDDAAIAREVNRYAEINGVEDTNGTLADETNDNVEAFYVQFVDDDAVHFDPPVPVGGGTIPTGASGVIVSTTMTQTNFLMGLIGQPTTQAGATATAVTGPLLRTGGLRPIGLPERVVEDLDEGDLFTINMENNCDEENCTVQYIRDDGEHMTHAHRGWLNLNYVWNQGEWDDEPPWPRAIDPNVGTGWGGPQHEGLMDWMLNPSPTVLYADCHWDDGCDYGDFIGAKPGLSWGAMTGQNPSLCEQISEELSILPVFDYVAECETEIPDPKPECPTQGGQSVGYAYHVVGFSAVYITGCSQGAGGVHNINMEMVETVIGQGQISTQWATGYDPENRDCGRFNNLQVVTLWH
jgi:hypothetical protein